MKLLKPYRRDWLQYFAIRWEIEVWCSIIHWEMDHIRSKSIIVNKIVPFFYLKKAFFLMQHFNLYKTVNLNKFSGIS